ncbi:MAG: DNA primase [Nitrospirota bacterium]|nr:DNA primase [Nitrospirota bacterium]
MQTERLLEDIKSRIDIVELISGFIQLKKTGQNWNGLCPFHTEKTPSFTVSQAKQIFHCFGCGVGGDVISFVSKYENLSFNESVALLAKKAGIPFTFGMPDKKTLQKNERIRNSLVEAMNYFVARLKESEAAAGYLKNRGLNSESLDLFRLGYAPPGWHNLLKHLRNSGYHDSIIKEAGMAVSGNRGFYDMFRERIIFPIMSISGNVVGFGGRAFNDAMPKYINSPETVVFKKSDTLFGLYNAKEEILKKDYVIIVEGYMDTIVCFQYGFRNVVAPLGTSLTSGHLQKLRALTDRAVLVFDGDAAGIAAAKRALALIFRMDFRPKVLLLPDREDPDSYLQKHGSSAFMSLLETAKSMIDFLFGVSSEEKIRTAREALTMIAGIKDLLVADEMLIELSEKTRINEAAIRQEYRNIKNRTVPRRNDSYETPPSTGNREEHILLSALIAFPEKIDYVLSVIDCGEIRDKTVASLLKKIASLKDKKDLVVLLDDVDEQEKSLFTKLSVDPGFDMEHADRNIEDCIERIRGNKLDERIRLAEVSGDIKHINSLLIEKQKLIKEKEL